MQQIHYFWSPEKQAFIGDSENEIIVNNDTAILFSQYSDQKLIRQILEKIDKAEETDEKATPGVLFILHSGPNDTEEKRKEMEIFMSNQFDEEILSLKGIVELVIITSFAQLSDLNVFKGKRS